MHNNPVCILLYFEQTISSVQKLKWEGNHIGQHQDWFLTPARVSDVYGKDQNMSKDELKMNGSSECPKRKNGRLQMCLLIKSSYLQFTLFV